MITSHCERVDSQPLVRLHEEQAYVTKLARQFGLVAELQHHNEVTNTCYEKAKLLGWDPERVIKTVYFFNGEEAIGVITPELGRKIDQKNLFSEVLNISRRQAGRYLINGYVPPGMNPGTCTPFPLESTVGSEIGRLIFMDHPPIEKQLSNVSIGGEGEEAHKVSMHIRYGGIFEILKEHFGDNVHRALWK